MRKFRWFAIIFLVILTAWITRTFLPRRVVDRTISISPIIREEPPPRLNISFANTDVLSLLEERKGMIDRLRGQVSELSRKLTTRQDLPPDTVIVYSTVIPSLAVRRGILHLRLNSGLLEVDLVDLADSLAMFSSWKRSGVRNDFEIWAMQDPELSPAQWIRLDEKRNIADIDFLALGFSTSQGPFIDFAKVRLWSLHLKGRAIQDGLKAEVWINVL